MALKDIRNKKVHGQSIRESIESTWNQDVFHRRIVTLMFLLLTSFISSSRTPAPPNVCSSIDWAGLKRTLNCQLKRATKIRQYINYYPPKLTDITGIDWTDFALYSLVYWCRPKEGTSIPAPSVTDTVAQAIERLVNLSAQR
jgi:hypothetical protein